MSTDGGGEPWDLHTERVQRARVPHKCDACKEPIRRGDRYYLFKGLFDSAWEVLRRCARCETMVRVLAPLMDYESEQVCDPRLNCGHTWEQNFGEPPPVEIQALAFLTPSEAQVLLHRWPAELRYPFCGPVEAPERTIARLLGWGRQAA